MPTINQPSHKHVLITRPEKQGRVLADKCRALNIATIVQPMFDYQPHCSKENILNTLSSTHNPTLIFVSVAAVDLATQILPIKYWQFDQVFAVGKATKTALEKIGIEAFCPTLQTSEGLLALTNLQEVKDKDILIIRGDGGRELIEQTLSIRGANVQYLEVYKRHWNKLSETISQHWRAQKINCLVITSNALLESVVNLLDLCDNYWRKDCLWIVASQRIANSAVALGIEQVINAEGAHDEAILKAITENGCTR